MNIKKNSQNILRLTSPTLLVTLTLVFALLLSGCNLLGPNPKGLANQTIDWVMDFAVGSQNPLKMPGLTIKAVSLAKKVAQLSERDKQTYSEELGRLVGSRANDLLTILRRDEEMAALLSPEAMGALLGADGLGGLLGIEGLDALLTVEGLSALAAETGIAQAGGSSSGSLVDTDKVVTGFLGGLFGGSSSNDVPDETKDSGGITGFLGGLFGSGSKNAAPKEKKESGGIVGFIGGLFGGDSKSGGILSGGKPKPLAANATHKQAMAKMDEVIAYLVKNPPEGTTELEMDMIRAGYNSYRGILQLTGIAWSDKETRDGMIEAINDMIKELE